MEKSIGFFEKDIKKVIKTRDLRDNLIYIDYTDTLKQEVEKYRVWYEPKEYSDYFNGKEYIYGSIYTSTLQYGVGDTIDIKIESENPQVIHFYNKGSLIPQIIFGIMILFIYMVILIAFLKSRI